MQRRLYLSLVLPACLPLNYKPLLHPLHNSSCEGEIGCNTLSLSFSTVVLPFAIFGKVETL